MEHAYKLIVLILTPMHNQSISLIAVAYYISQKLKAPLHNTEAFGSIYRVCCSTCHGATLQNV